MLKILTSIFFLLTYIQTKAQISEKADSIATEICESFNQIPSKIDSAIVTETFIKHLNQYLKNMKRDDQEKAINKIYIRLQFICDKFVIYMKRYEIKGWTRVEKCPQNNISKTELDKFFSIHNFYYIEPSGDTTILELLNDSWIDRMNDGTHSKLSLKRLSPFDFVITFIESTNNIKRNMSKVGDEYYYSIISKQADSYELCTTVPRISGATIFKVYIKD